MEAHSFLAAVQEFSKIDHARCNALFASHFSEVMNAYGKSKGDSTLFGLGFIGAWELAVLIGTVVVWLRPAKKASNWVGRVMLPLFVVFGATCGFLALVAAANYAEACRFVAAGQTTRLEPFVVPSAIALLPLAVFFTLGALMFRYPRLVATANYEMRHPGRPLDENDRSFKTNLFMAPIMGVLFMAGTAVVGWSLLSGFFNAAAVR